MRLATTALISFAALTAACSSNPSPTATTPQPAPAPTPVAVAPAPATTTTTTTTTTTPTPTTSTAVDMSGAWAATLDVQGQTIVVDINLTRGANGYTGDAAPQGQPSAPLSSLTLVGDRVTLTFATPDAGDAVFAGTLAPDRRAVAGTLSYQGQSLPFTMTKKP